MAIEFSREPLDDCFEEMGALVHDYFESTIADRDVPPLDFDWNHYHELDKLRRIVLVTARIRDITHARPLVGFVFYIVMNHPHHRTTKIAYCDLLAVRPEMRGMGIARNLMAKAEDYLRIAEVDRIIHSFRMTYANDESPLFPKLGYEPHEVAYQKVLAD
jgi:GNAT superfamily N-acetyltransferase